MVKKSENAIRNKKFHRHKKSSICYDNRFVFTSPKSSKYANQFSTFFY